MNKDYAHSMQDDIISRQDAMGTMLNLFHWCTMPTRKEIRKAIEAIPSAEPKTGAWIRCKEQDEADLDNGNALYECSNCGHTDLHSETQEVPYCWFCGSDMRGDKNG